MVGGREEYAIVLDFLPYGKAGEAQREPVAQVIGENFFTLLEVVPKADVKLDLGSRVYIGRETREQVDHIRKRVSFNELTSTARQQANTIVRNIVRAREKEFVEFFNRAGPINIRAHTLEQIPSVGKKHLQAILDARDKKAFESFRDIQERVPHLTKVEDIVVERVFQELREETKYYLFTKPPSRHLEE